MARIRTIKPEFFLNEQLATLGFGDRLLFVGLWLLADRAGRLEDRPLRIKAALFPYDEIDVDAGLARLAAADGLILRYQVDGQRLICIPTWEKHQQPHVKERASTLPPPDEHQARTVPAPENPVLAPVDAQTTERTGDSESPVGHRARTVPAPVLPVGREGKGKDQEGKGGRTRHAPGPLAGSLPRDHIDHGFCGSRFCVKAKHVAELARSYGDGGEQAVEAFLTQLDAGLRPDESAGGYLWVLQAFEAHLTKVGRLKTPSKGAPPAAPLRELKPEAPRQDIPDGKTAVEIFQSARAAALRGAK